jgi:hypothetical protein
MAQNDVREHVQAGLERIRELQAQGANLTEPRWQSHRFMGHPESLESLSVALRHAGYTVNLEDDNLIAHSFAVVDEPRLRENFAILCRVADHFEVALAGWSAASDAETA